MAELASAFEKAQSNVEPSDEDWGNAPDAHAEIAEILGADDTLKEWGIDPILIGSYGRRVSIRRVYDVDMFCRLDEYPDGTRAEEVLDHVFDVLVDAYDEDAVTREDRSVTVLVPDADGLYVDVVPARAAGDRWEIPTEDDKWVETNPVRMTELKEEKNSDFNDMYVPCVKLLRQARRNLVGKRKPGGFAIEMALYTACDEGLVTASTSMAEFFTSAIEGVADVLRRVADDGFQMPDPSMEGEVLDFDDDADFSTAASAFESAAADARTAYEMHEDDAGKAALLMQGIFGGNDDFENVFPMPSGYDKDGNKRASSQRTAGDRKPTTGPLRFG
jgi:Second Messenger Oligonucleotide or Dinucleotide Synthetase domain